MKNSGAGAYPIRLHKSVFAILFFALTIAAGAQEAPRGASARLIDVRTEAFAERIEIDLIGDGRLTYDTFWLSRPTGEILVIDLPGVTVVRPMNLDLTADTAPAFPWKSWPVRSVRSVQMSDDATRVTIQLASLSAGGFRPEIKIAEGMNQLVLSIARSAAPLTAVPTAVEEIGAPLPPTPDVPRRRITLRFRDADLAEILQTLADQARMNLIVDPKLTGKATVSLEDVSLVDALDALLKGSGFGWVIDGNILRIIPDRFLPAARVVIPVGDGNGTELLGLLKTYASSPGLLVFDPQSNAIIYTSSQPGEAESLQAIAAELSRRQSERALDGDGHSYFSTIPLLYAEPADVVKLIETMMADDNVVSTADVRSHAVFVRAPSRASLARVIRFIQTADKPTPQVLLKVRIIESTVNASDVLGVEWSSSVSFTASALSQPQRILLRPDEPVTGPVTFGTLTTSGLSAVMNFLENNGKSVVLSAPEILVLDRENAEILVGSREPIRTTTTSQGVVSENIEFVDIGVVLRVLPIILPGNRVMLTVHPENSSASRSEIAGVPRISTSEATTRILVDHGRTAVIGGLYSESLSEADRRVPFLGSIPFLGRLFRNDNTSTARRNLMVFITPYVLGEQGTEQPEINIEGPDESSMARWVQELRNQDHGWHRDIRDAVTGAEMKDSATVGAIPNGRLR